MRLALTVVAVLAIGWAEPAGAADWVDSVFPDRLHEFGAVAKGSKVRHSFKVVNTTNQEIHIASWQPKCGCTDVRVGAREIPPGAQTVIEASIDTTRFNGPKSSGLILVVDRPTTVSISLDLTCIIRTDVTLNPGQVDFGVVNRTTKPKVEVTLSYAGAQADWAIVKSNHISSSLDVLIQEQGRSAGGQVNYLLTATLKPSAPIGYFKDEITLTTNDPNSKNIPVSVSAVVQSNVTVAPSVINLGTLKAGSTVQKMVVIRSAQTVQVNGHRPRLDRTVRAAGRRSVEGPPHGGLDIQGPVEGWPVQRVGRIRVGHQGRTPDETHGFRQRRSVNWLTISFEKTKKARPTLEWSAGLFFGMERWRLFQGGQDRPSFATRQRRSPVATTGWLAGASAEEGVGIAGEEVGTGGAGGTLDGIGAIFDGAIW